MKAILSQMAASRIFWLGVFLICVALEGGALFYQHVLGLSEEGEKVFYQPCELCIYTRVWIAGLAIFALIAMATVQFKWVRRVLLLIQTVLIVGLSNEVFNLLKVEYQFGDGGSCKFMPNFYSWAPLDVWMPHMFQVREMCQATPKVFGPISMVHGLTLVCVMLFVSFVIAGYQEWKKR